MNGEAQSTLHNRDSACGWLAEGFVLSNETGGGVTPTIVAKAAALINLAHLLRQSDEQTDITRLRQIIVDAITRYERDLTALRIDPERARAAHYVVCATIDDVVLNKEWGVRAGWAQLGLVSTFHMDVTGGDRVFELLEYFHQDPEENRDLLHLIYLSLSLAFEGRTRVSAHGATELALIRDNLYNTLKSLYRLSDRKLSPHWRGVSAPHTLPRTWLLFSTLLVLLGLALTGGFLSLSVSLNRAATNTSSRLAHLPPHEVASLNTPHSEPMHPPQTAIRYDAPTLPESKKSTRLDTLLTFLHPETEKKLISLSNSDRRLLVRINNSGMFAPGSDKVTQQFQDLLQRIGAALAAEKFRAHIIGYTDNSPIHTAQFPTNWHLSASRAKAVGEILAAYTGPEAITTEGRADTNPIASNTTPAGREINRRTEILILADPNERLDETAIAREKSLPAHNDEFSTKEVNH